MTYELKDWLNSINQNKKNIMNDDQSSEKDYAPYIINRCLSGHIDCVMYANEMNKYNFLPKRLQYDFFINIVRTKKRYSPWLNKEKIKDIDYVKRYYGYNNEKALQALSILSKEQLTFIKAKFETGGTK
jgi:hypothetical protein